MSSRHPLGALLLLAAFATLAFPRNPVLNASNVTIVSIDAHQLVVLRMVKGKPEQIRFVVTADTVRTGTLSVGSHVTVHYRTQNHENIATSVQARQSTPKARQQSLPD